MQAILPSQDARVARKKRQFPHHFHT